MFLEKNHGKVEIQADPNPLLQGVFSAAEDEALDGIDETKEVEYNDGVWNWLVVFLLLTWF